MALGDQQSPGPMGPCQRELVSTSGSWKPRGEGWDCGLPALGEKAQPVCPREVTLGDPAGCRTVTSTPSGAALYRELTQHLGGRSGRSPRLVQAQIFQFRKR